MDEIMVSGCMPARISPVLRPPAPAHTSAKVTGWSRERAFVVVVVVDVDVDSLSYIRSLDLFVADSNAPGGAERRFKRTYLSKCPSIFLTSAMDISLLEVGFFP